ncbi:MAG: DUF2807 domain-containing protein [Rikenellaceae bacterium]|nr:DUF2807 domain-containing protein [Rikenellaceae bacterium]
MKKLILSVILLLFAASNVIFAASQSNKVASTEKSEWLPSFTAIEVSAALDIVFVKVPTSDAPKIVYDTKGSYTTKFEFKVKDKVLHITERVDPRRPERTTVKVYYNTVDYVSVAEATASFEGTVKATTLDLAIGARASLTAALDVKDLDVKLTGRSTATLSGSVRYLTLAVSTGKADALQLETMSADVDASNNGTASLSVTERLCVTTTTGGKVNYKGQPEIVRGGAKFMGGDIKRIQ